MIKTLKKRFIFSCMLAITILLVTLLGGINIVNVFSVSKDNEELLYRLSQNEQELSLNNSVLDNFENMIPKEGRLEQDFNISKNEQMSAVYFIVRENSDGDVEQIDMERIASVGASTALDLYNKIKDGKTTGKIGHYRYQAVVTLTGMSYVFLDLEFQIQGLLRIAFLSILAGIVAWLLMLMLVIGISNRAIAPIAENMEKQKQFITNAGHEIKTPLAIILTNTEALELHTEETKWSKNIRTQVARMTSLTQNLLTLAKLDEQSDVSMEDVNISSILETKVNDFGEVANAKNITIHTDIDKNVYLYGNEIYLNNLTSIFMDNAMKYANENGTLNVICKQKESIDLIFENTCENIQNIKIENLTDRFYQNDTSHTSNGFGIGLSAAQSIMDLHGGKLEITVDDQMIHFILHFKPQKNNEHKKSIFKLG